MDRILLIADKSVHIGIDPCRNAIGSERTRVNPFSESPHKWLCEFDLRTLLPTGGAAGGKSHRGVQTGVHAIYVPMLNNVPPTT